MKSRNLVIALLATVFAVSSAFSTKNATVYNVKVWWKNSPASNWICNPLPLACVDGINHYICELYVIRLDGSGKTVNAHGYESTCSTPLYHYSDTPIYYDGLDHEDSRPFDVSTYNW